MRTEDKKEEDYRIVALNGRLRFQDRAPDDPRVGPARMVDIAARCTACWGPVIARIEGNRRLIHIECRVCDRRVDVEDGEREWKRMTLEADRNLPGVRIGRGAQYDENASFVLKILPDMDRNQAEFEERVDAARRRVQLRRKRGRWLTRLKFEEAGSPGYLHLQACALVRGLDALPREKSAISTEDFDFDNVRDLSAPKVDDLGRLQLSAKAPLRPSIPGRTVERMGTAMIAGFTAAFACEVGMKAILMTRLDEAKMTHDLLELYESLPGDCRERLQGDFDEIADIFREYGQVFGEWRYFEPGAGQDALLALVDTDRTWGLERAARVIVDEGLVAGLQYDIDLRYDIDVEGKAHVNEDLTFSIVPGDASASTTVSMEIRGHESAISWDAILSL